MDANHAIMTSFTPSTDSNLLVHHPNGVLHILPFLQLSCGICFHCHSPVLELTGTCTCKVSTCVCDCSVCKTSQIFLVVVLVVTDQNVVDGLHFFFLLDPSYK